MSVIYIDKEQRKRERPFSDLSVWSLIISNLIVGAWAVATKWSFSWMLWIYWIQSVSIGIFWFIRICKFTDVVMNPRFKTANRTLNTFGGFIVGYTAFHLILGAIIWFHLLKDKPTRATFYAGGIFVLNGVFSLIHNKVPKHKIHNLITSMDFPMMRIFPIHLTIFLGLVLRDFWGITLGGTVTVSIFILFKILVDVGMYLKERELFYHPRRFQI